MKSWQSRAAVAVAATLVLTACGTDAPGAPSAAPTSATPSSAPASDLAPSSTPASTAPSPTPPKDCVTRTLDGLDLAGRAGQLLMVGLPVDTPTGYAGAVRAYRLGGIFLRGRSTHAAAELRGDIANVQGKATLPLLVALDQEGGSVQTLKGPDFPILPSAARLGAGPVTTLRGTTQDSARRLSAIGVNMNLAPVADTVPADIGEDNPPIGAFRRQYGSDPAKVATAIRTVVPASQDAGVLTTLKHFPGLGRVRANTDTSTKAVDTTATVNDPYLQPFAAGIDAGAAAVMISSASYPRLDSGAIAAYSRPIVTDLLRGKLGFKGLVISDDLGAAKAASTLPPAQRAVRFVAAGGDMVLTIVPSDAKPMSAALIERAESDPAFRARVDDAARHVLQTKERAGLLRCG
ncbi:beta-glucosidase [Paractinoplanes deccanensis]|uniref:beta-N-acetylhexosaminidase n=1 Tax=Paractinoplanes deccanensis TaxID=113561 RepID=A0ABQ3Y9D0_9ACTN|nr:glycoside hydrolase family 3 protein [Actinoplanes deccanensis]GID76611.1 beta-glucosidase [Actinoplanes deccanensis]